MNDPAAVAPTGSRRVRGFRPRSGVHCVHGMSIVRAAGGLLWREGPTGPRLAVVHRPRKDGWSLPKGKLEDGESWKHAAVREVREETGCEGRITAFAGASFYLARRAPKLVLYWHMALVQDGPPDLGGEIGGVAWLSPADAMERLHHGRDRRLVARALRRGVLAAPALPAAPPWRLVARAGAWAALAAGVALGVAAASPAKRRAFVAGGATGLVGAASVVLAVLAAGRHRRPRR